MKYLFEGLKKLKRSIKGRGLFLFLDFDGTLAPIAPTPEKADLPPPTRKLLKKLAGLKGCKTTIISGRTLGNIKEKTGVAGLVYAGNHGAHIEGPGIRLKKNLKDREKKALKKFRKLAERAVKGLKGVFIEDKAGLFTVHYRLASRENATILKKKLGKIRREMDGQKALFMRMGKKNYEVLPLNNWDKGKAVLWMLDRWRKEDPSMKPLVIYAGDDRTDADAFRALKGKGITIFVGKGGYKYPAEYFLKNTLETARFLKYIIDLKKTVKGQ